MTDPALVVAARDAPGGASPGRVREHARRVRRRVGAARQWNAARRAREAEAEAALITAAQALTSGGWTPRQANTAGRRTPPRVELCLGSLNTAKDRRISLAFNRTVGQHGAFQK